MADFDHVVCDLAVDVVDEGLLDCVALKDDQVLRDSQAKDPLVDWENCVEERLLVLL